MDSRAGVLGALRGFGWMAALAVTLLAWLGLMAGLDQGARPPSGSAVAATTVQADATQGWQATGLNLASGEVLRIAVTAGTWTYWIGGSPLQPGTGDDYICANLFPIAQCVEPMPYERKGALIGRISGGPPFLIGERNTITAAAAGPLELRINDPDSALHDNDGILTVRLGDPEATATAVPNPGPSETRPAPSAVPYPGPSETPAGPTATAGAIATVAPTSPVPASPPAPTDEPGPEPGPESSAAPMAAPATPVLPERLPQTGRG